jgi:hypothetical protein
LGFDQLAAGALAAGQIVIDLKGGRDQRRALALSTAVSLPMAFQQW